MPKYELILQPEAELDLDEAYEYLNSQRNNLGFDLLEELSDLFEMLKENPFLFQRVHRDTRRAITKKLKFNIFYKVLDDTIFILAILHGSQNPNKWKDRRV
ncbi:MAG: type II toxin-antitoxin system RelE/ParE family toxin [Bacteroidota bacterium]